MNLGPLPLNLSGVRGSDRTAQCFVLKNRSDVLASPVHKGNQYIIGRVILRRRKIFVFRQYYQARRAARTLLRVIRQGNRVLPFFVAVLVVVRVAHW